MIIYWITLWGEKKNLVGGKIWVRRSCRWNYNIWFQHDHVSAVLSQQQADRVCSQRSLTLWDKRPPLLILLGSPQMTNTLGTESLSRYTSRCSWPSNQDLSFEDPLNFMSLQQPAPLRDFSKPNSSVCALKPCYHPCSLESCLIVTFDHTCVRQSWLHPP